MMTLRLENVTVTVPDGRERLTILNDVSFSVEPGEVVALVGPSGSGKSTVVAVAALLLRPDAGTVTVAGIDAGDASARQRTTIRRYHIGVVYQSANLVPSLTALEQVELVAHIDGHLDRRARVRAEELLAGVGLGDRLNSRPGELSGGERQRVGIARALMNSPEVLLADEPTAALDADRGAKVMDLLVEQATNAGASTLIVTHVPDQVRADRQITLDHARIIERTTTVEA